MKAAVCVTVEVVPWLTDYFGHRGRGRLHLEERVVQGATVLDLMRNLATRYPGFAREAFSQGELGGHIAVLLNGRWLQPSYNLDATLESDDTVTLLPAFTGGR